MTPNAEKTTSSSPRNYNNNEFGQWPKDNTQLHTNVLERNWREKRHRVCVCQVRRNKIMIMHAKKKNTQSTNFSRDEEKQTAQILWLSSMKNLRYNFVVISLHLWLENHFRKRSERGRERFFKHSELFFITWTVSNEWEYFETKANLPPEKQKNKRKKRMK